MNGDSSSRGCIWYLLIFSMFAPIALRVCASVSVFHREPTEPPHWFIPLRYVEMSLFWALVITALGGALIALTTSITHGQQGFAARQEERVIATGAFAGWLLVLVPAAPSSLQVFLIGFGLVVIGTSFVMVRLPERFARNTAWVIGGITVFAALAVLLYADGHYYASIHIAARAGDVEALRLYIKEDASVVNKLDAKGETPLFLAVRANRVSAVRYLLEQGAQVDVQSQDGQLPVDWANNEEMRDLLIK